MQSCLKTLIRIHTNSLAPISPGVINASLVLINSIQYLRGLAAILVFCHHWVQLVDNGLVTTQVGSWAFRYGPFGVNLFFVISGFIISRTITSNPTPPLIFAARRVVRIFPAYWVFTLVLAGIVSWFPVSFSFTTFSTKSLVLSLLLIPNHNPSGIGLYPFLTVGWTLTFELFFYGVVFGCLCFAKTQWNHASVIALVGLALFYPDHFYGSHILGSYHLLEFAGGILLEKYYGKVARMPSGLRNFASVALFFFGIVALALDPKLWLFSAIFIVASVVLPSGIRMPDSVHRTLFQIGTISYSIYLSHIVVIGMVVELRRTWIAEPNEAIVFMLALVGTLFISWVAYAWVERPAIGLLKSPVKSGLRKSVLRQ